MGSSALAGAGGGAMSWAAGDGRESDDGLGDGGESGFRV
jgi:hypothetical protein